MADTRYGVPLWPAALPRSRRSRYPRLRGRHDLDVAVVGGGLTGCATAYALAAAGVSVALLEAESLGAGATARGTGLVALEPAAAFTAVEQAWGRRAARTVWHMTRRAGLDLAATVRRLGLRCHLEPIDMIMLAPGEDEASFLQRELRARRKAKIDGTWLPMSRVREATKVPAAGGIRTRGGAQLDPLRLCLGLAAAAQARGAAVHERSRVSKIKPTRDAVDVTTDGGELRAQCVVVATDEPTSLFPPLRRHFSARQSYVVATPPLGAKVRRELGRREAAVVDQAEPPHYLRWTRDHRLLFAGADQPSPPVRQHDKVLVQRTGQLMYELSTLYPVISGLRPEHAWALPIAAMADGQPLIGPHRHFPRHLFALGVAHGGATASFLAARVLLRHHLDRSEKGDELFGFSR